MKKLKETLKILQDPANLAFIAFAVGAFNFLLIALHFNNRPFSNSGSRFATIESLIHRGTFQIDDSTFQTVDKVKIGDHFYSSKPPLLPTLTAGAYWVYSHFTGKNFQTARQDAIHFCILISSGLCHLLLLYFFFLCLTLLYSNPLSIFMGFLLLTFGFLGTGYATDLNNHTPAAAMVVIAFYCAYRLMHKPPRKNILLWLSCGFFSGLAAAFDLPALIYALGFAVYLYPKRSIQNFVVFAFGLSLPLIAHFILSFISTGSLLPVYARPEVYVYPGSYWLNPVSLDALNEPKWIYFLNSLFGHHGFLIMTPVLIFALWELIEQIWHWRKWAREAILVFASFIIIFSFYVAVTHNYGGLCIGYRWLLFLTPLMLLFVPAWTENQPISFRIGLVVLTGLVGAFHTADTIIKGPWGHSLWEKFLRY